jgi:hypothetical protein
VVSAGSGTALPKLLAALPPLAPSSESHGHRSQPSTDGDGPAAAMQV